MGTRPAVRVYCEDCDTEGPEGESAAEARHLAELSQWMIGSDTGHVRAPDFCPACRGKHEFRCDGDNCHCDGLYQIAGPTGKSVSGCGKHFGALLRNMFNEAGAGTELRVRKLRPVRGGDATREDWAYV